MSSIGGSNSNRNSWGYNVAMRISLSKGRAYTVVDDADFESLNQYKWHIVGGKYAARRLSPSKEYPSGEYIYMHRQIMDTPKDRDTDHINGDGLDNRRGNLRICTTHQNLGNKGKMSFNTSGFKGVTISKGRFIAQIGWRENGIRKNKVLGIFDNPIDAAKAYDKAAKQRYGDFAWLNLGERG